MNKEEMSVKKIAKKNIGTKRNPVLSDIKRDSLLYLMLIPFVVYYALFVFKPMWSLQIAFKDYSVYKGVAASEWVGLKHFRSFFSGPYFGRLLKNTLLLSFCNLGIVFPASIVLALLLNEIRCVWFKKSVQMLTYLPHFISTVVIVGIINSFLSPSNGLVNIIIEKLGGDKIYFLAEAKWFRTIYTVMNLWVATGYGSIVYIAALAGVDMQLYEACRMDGGGKWRQFVHVTFPGILPTIMIMFIMKIGSILNVGYEQIILMYQPSTYETADIFNTFVFRTGIQNGDYSLSTAVGLFNSAVGLVLVTLANKISARVTETSLW